MKLFLFFVFLGILSIFLYIIGGFLPNQSKDLDSIQIGSQQLYVETANTPAKISLGLGKRDKLGSDGMLFVLPNKTIPTFWMKDMRFDLDFVWIDTNRVVDITENVPAQRGSPDSALRIYSPRSPVTHVLEMNAGQIQKRGIKIGDSFQIRN